MGTIQEPLDESRADAFICKPFTIEERQTKLKKTVEQAEGKSLVMQRRRCDWNFGTLLNVLYAQRT